MKKLLFFFCTAILLGYGQFAKAQCYGTVNYDASVNGNGASNFSLTTANANEIILISLDGYGPTDISDPGPVTVDGNNATLINTANIGNSGTAEVWAYAAAAAGAHTIVCPETDFETPYYLNFAAAFYSSGSCTPLSLTNITSVEKTVTDSTGGVIFDNITTTAPNSIVYCDAAFNTGNATSFPITWNNATSLATLHEGNGLEGSDAYEAEATAGTYTITARNSSPYTGGGGMNLILVDITPPACGVTVSAAATTEPTCGSNNGTATATVSGGTSPYTYSWSPTGGTNVAATGLSAGTYTINVTDNKGCTGSASVTLVATSNITSTTSFTDVACSGGNNGSAEVTATGGTTPYTYLWNPSAETTQMATGLSTGTYTVTITDANGCSATNSVTIGQSALLNATTSSTSATCGQDNGSATVSISGGTLPYTYLWSPGGGTTATISNISAGTYTVTVYDSNGCNVNAAVTVANSSGINTSITSFTDVLCNGGSTGSATVTATGGTLPYTYSWAPSGGTNATATGLSAGTYTVTVTDANGCNTPAIAIITQPKVVRDSISAVTYPLCHGETGTATVGVKGGVSPYTYSWSPSGGTNATATGLTAGTYSITVTDKNGCASTVTVTITQPVGLSGTYSTTKASCGNDNGTITATISGGTTPYTYVWTPSGQTTVTATGLSAGTYTLVVTDANGCSATGTATVTALSSPTVTVTSATNDKCNGNTNGSATVSATGGTSPYTYLWAPGGSTTATESNLSAGTYTITVHDSSGCVATTTVTITQPTTVNGTVTTTEVLCNGGTGSATVAASGGTSPYTYVWNPSAQTNATATGLTAGTYTVTITDANGCTGSSIVTLTQPTALRDSISAVTYPICNGGTGTATVGVKGGTTPYTYLWNPTAQTNATATGLTAGTYTITVTDNNGCSKTASVTITQPTPIVVTTTNTKATCGNNNGTATAIVTGGVSPYTYLWNPTGQTTTTATGLSVGTYTITVTDKDGCTGSATTNITAVNSPTITVTSTTNDKCNGGITGSGTVSVTGGTSPYTYLWAPGGSTTATESNLSAGTYTITVHDSSGCLASLTLTITQPTPVSGTATSAGELCNAGNSATATVTAAGGTSPYTYLWNPSAQTNATATGLSAGTYTITITDNNGCTGTATVTVTQPSAIRDSISAVTYPACNGGTGTATIGVKDGTSPYTYLWNPSGQTNTTATGLSAGTYTITVTDKNGCTKTSTVTITQPTPIVVTTTDTKATCGNNNGTATAVVTGGSSPYTYAWSPTGQTTATATGLSVGTYTIIVTDKNGCTGSATATIIAVNSPTVTVSSTTNDKCNAGSTGSATVSVTGGSSPYTYLWAPGGSTTATESNLSAGTYTITVHDSSGCVTTTTVTITQPTPITATATSTGELCNGGNTATATVTASGGTSPYTYVWNPSAQTNATATGLTAGTYTVTITDNNGCTGSAIVTITQPTAILNTVSGITYPLCNGGTGSATITSSGGTSPYTYLWTPGGGTNATESGLSASTYTVTVTDANGCSGTSVIVTITQPTAIVPITHTNPTPCGDSTGLAWVSVTGGTGPYTYLWNPTAQTTDSALNLSAGTYTITVTDKNGCSQTSIATVTTTTSVNLADTSTGVLCNGESNGSITITASGGVSPYTYQWNPNVSTTNSVSGLSAGTYTVTVTDTRGCNNTITVTVTQPNVLAAPPTVNNITCNGLNNGTASVSPTGGTAPYTYAWSPIGNTTAAVSGLTVGTYTIVVTDANGCSVTSTFSISQPTALSATLTSTSAACVTNNGTATVTAAGGTTSYTYSWNPSAQTNATATGLSAGIYTVTVNDANGCTEMDTITVHSNSTLSITSTNTDELCNGSTTATASVTATGGTSPYTYLWSPGAQTNATATGLSAGTYTIVVTDNVGCTQFDVITITQPGAIVPTTSSTGAGCANNAGTATVSATGGTGAYTYSWVPGGATTATITGLGSGAYTVTVTDANGCSVTAATNVANGGVSGSITASTNVACFGNNSGSATVTASGSASPFTYSWTPSGQTNATATGLSEGSYTVTVTDANGCTFSTDVTITGPLAALAATATATNALCNSTNNGSIALNVSGGTMPYTFAWSNSGTTQNLNNLLPGTYTVSVTDSNGCSATNSVIVGADTSVIAKAGNDTIICHNSTIELNGTGSINATGYAWYQMPGMILLKDSSVVFVTPTNDTTQYVLVVSYGVCTDTSSVVIVTLPALNINPGPDQVIYGTGSVTLGGNPTGPSGVTYDWQPSVTLNDSVYSNPIATTTVTTVYTVTISNSEGCKASDTVTVFILPGISPPSGFTPNGDGVNDYWVLPFAVDFPNIEVEVYNRWGELLFHSDGYNTPWDGTYNGKAVPIGTYYYIINLNDPRFPKAMTGPLTILR